MNANLPAYLQGKPTSRRLVDTAAEGLGSRLPPHISIRGNSFTLIDVSGQEQELGATMNAVVVDISDVVTKRYMDPAKPWTPDSNDPPVCWSSNGIGPSIESSSPQAPTCFECEWNKRGSAVSKISGAAIKACRDEKYLVLLIPQFNTLWRLVLTPGSFANYTSYLAKFKGQQFDIDDVVTQIGFQPKVNGVLTFAGVAQISGDLVVQRNAALTDQAKRDELAGRLDRPVGAARLSPPPAAPGLPAPTAASPLTGTAPAPTQTASPAPGVFPSETAPETAPRRRGRPKAAEPAAGGQATNNPVTAPFRPSEAPFGANGGSSAAGGQSGFGMASGVAPNAEISQALDSMFGTK